NFGEIPASSVTAESAVMRKLPDRETLKSAELTRFNLGPLLPGMEKRYWFFVDSDLIGQSTAAGKSQVFVLLHFKYDFPSGASGYGMISEFEPLTGLFVHRDMWVD